MRPKAPSTATHRFAVAVTALVAVLALVGCGVSNLAFVADNRLHFISPRQRALVRLPVTISWRMSDFQVVPAGSVPPSTRSGYFAVFVDHSPVRPGQTLAAVADKQCRRTPGCLNASYLAVRGVYTTNATSLTLTVVRLLNSYQKVQTHEATVVLLDAAGRRIGESAWYIDFRMRGSGH